MEVAPVTSETFDPLVVQVEAAIVIVTVSGLVPPACRAGSNVTVPVPEQVMLPVATVGALVDEVVDVGLLVVDVGLLVVDVELLGLEEHAASPSDSANPTSRSLGMRRTTPTIIDRRPAPGSSIWQRMCRAECSVVGPFVLDSDLRRRGRHRTGVTDAIEAHHTVVFTTLAVAREVQHRTGLTVRKVCRQLRPLRSASVAIDGAEQTFAPVISSQDKAVIDAIKRPEIRTRAK